MSDTDTTTEAGQASTTAEARPAVNPDAPPLYDVPDLTAEEIVRFQAWLEDKAVRAARSHGYCDETDRILRQIFGKSMEERALEAMDKSTYSARFRDSEGVACDGQRWHDDEGYDRHGYNSDGYDRGGYDRDGRDRYGFDRDGRDAHGMSRDDPARYIYDYRGYTAAWDASGRDRDGVHKDSPRAARKYGFDPQGFNRDGVNRHGYNRAGAYVGESAV